VRASLCLITTLFVWVCPPTWAQSKPSCVPDWPSVQRSLKKNGFNKQFIADMKKSYETKHFEQVLELNVLLYLRKTDIHSVQISDAAVKSIRGFVNDHQDAFKKAEHNYGVSASVVASLLWLESRYGQNPGRFHVASAFLHLIQAERPAVLSHLRDAAVKFKEKPTPKDLKEIAKRTKKKSRWALAELKALEKIHKKDPAFVRHLRGSFAGAFGMPQFLPSSYLKWAKGLQKKKSPDLYRPDDAIQSVAYYLKANGWRKNKSKSHMKALLHYNNSEDYANTILSLAKMSDGQQPPKRLPTASNAKKK
jgi:membrane-bound lytic murein transglycosylase B